VGLWQDRYKGTQASRDTLSSFHTVAGLLSAHNAFPIEFLSVLLLASGIVSSTFIITSQ
jgi:hypothetical protein